MLHEDLLEPRLVFCHVEPAGFVCCYHSTDWMSLGPGIVTVAALGLVYCHRRQHGAVRRAAEHNREGCFAVVLYLNSEVKFTFSTVAVP